MGAGCCRCPPSMLSVSLPVHGRHCLLLGPGEDDYLDDLKVADVDEVHRILEEDRIGRLGVADDGLRRRSIVGLAIDRSDTVYK
ncbi:hypothetical protein ACLOJK_016657 [Asimina triloba]